MALKKLSIEATEIFLGILEQLGDKASTKINNAPKAYMPLSVEKLYNTSGDLFPDGQVYSLTHYYEQQGDLMRDPDVEFLVLDKRSKPGGSNKPDFIAVIPIHFRQDGICGRDQQIIEMENCQGTGKYSKSALSDCVTFCNMWMKNLKQQQDIKPVKFPKNQTKRESILTTYRKIQAQVKEMGFNSIHEAMASDKAAELEKLLASSCNK
jgi:hypothetical protein